MYALRLNNNPLMITDDSQLILIWRHYIAQRAL
jgi:hypothetical protein